MYTRYGLGIRLGRPGRAAGAMHNNIIMHYNNNMCMRTSTIEKTTINFTLHNNNYRLLIHIFVLTFSIIMVVRNHLIVLLIKEFVAMFVECFSTIGIIPYRTHHTLSTSLKLFLFLFHNTAKNHLCLSKYC